MRLYVVPSAAPTGKWRRIARRRVTHDWRGFEHHYHIAVVYLVRRAQEAASRENPRRLDKGRSGAGRTDRNRRGEQAAKPIAGL